MCAMMSGHAYILHVEHNFLLFFFNTLCYHLTAQIMTQIPDLKLLRGHDFVLFYFYWRGSSPFVLSPSCHHPVKTEERQRVPIRQGQR